MKTWLRVRSSRRGVLLVVVAFVAVAGFAVAASAAPVGRMGVVAAANPPGSATAYLNDVACVDTSHCLAVGVSTAPDGTNRTLIERWTGSAWQIVPSPTPQSTSTLLFVSISCATAKSCLAVGSYKRAGTDSWDALVERWNGTRWRILPAPTFGVAGSHQFSAVSCPGPRFCVAIGQNWANTRSERPSYGVVASWHGTNWQEVHRDRSARMEGVSCASTRSCMVIFAPGKGNNLHRLQLVGRIWTAYADGPKGVQEYLTFEDLDCLTATSCTAVGYRFSFIDPIPPVAWRWNGRVWHNLHPVRPKSEFTYLNGVSCPTANECVAVGSVDRKSPRYGGYVTVPLVERFHAGHARVVPAQAAANSDSTALGAVACFRGGLCRGVGGRTPHATKRVRTFADSGVLFSQR